MIRLVTFAAFALALATSAQAMSPVPLHHSEGIVTQVRHACGAGMHYVNGSCVTMPPAATSAGARYGVQGTFAVNGIDTPEPVSGIRRGGLRVAPTLFGRPSTSHVSPLQSALVGRAYPRRLRREGRRLLCFGHGLAACLHRRVCRRWLHAAGTFAKGCRATYRREQ